MKIKFDANIQYSHTGPELRINDSSRTFKKLSVKQILMLTELHYASEKTDAPQIVAGVTTVMTDQVRENVRKYIQSADPEQLCDFPISGLCVSIRDGNVTVRLPQAMSVYLDALRYWGDLSDEQHELLRCAVAKHILCQAL